LNARAATIPNAGWLNKQVADELGAAEKTIKIHRGRGDGKNGCHVRGGAGPGGAVRERRAADDCGV